MNHLSKRIRIPEELQDWWWARLLCGPSSGQSCQGPLVGWHRRGGCTESLAVSEPAGCRCLPCSSHLYSISVLLGPLSPSTLLRCASSLKAHPSLWWAQAPLGIECLLVPLVWPSPDLHWSLVFTSFLYSVLCSQQICLLFPQSHSGWLHDELHFDVFSLSRFWKGSTFIDSERKPLWSKEIQHPRLRLH